MKRFLHYSAVLVWLLVLPFAQSCDSISTDPESPQISGVDCNLVEIDSVGEPSGEDALRTISVTMSDREGNSLKLSVLSAHTYLEAGYYRLVSGTPSSRLEARVEAVVDGRQLLPSDGTLYVRRQNYDYWITCELYEDASSDQPFRFFSDAKKLYFESEEYPSLHSGGKGEEVRNQLFQSEILGKLLLYNVLLPENYDPEGSYPVLYILHGMGGGNTDWFDDGAVNAYMSETEGVRDMIVVSPEGRNWFYCNGLEAGINYADYFFEELLPFIESEYAVDPEARSIAGLSMGGYGALYYGFLHPEMFRSVYACSPAVNIDMMNIPDLESMLPALAGAGIENLPEITIEIGTSDFLHYNVQLFLSSLDSYGVAYDYISRQGVHDWAFWNACTPKILRQATASTLVRP